MVKVLQILLMTLVLPLSLSGNALAKPITPEEIFSDDQIASFRISPTGKYIAYVAPVGKTEILTIAELKGMKPVFTTQMGDDRFVGNYLWVNDERIMLWPAKRWGIHENVYLTGEIQAMNYDGSDNVKLWGFRGGSGKGEKRYGFLNIASYLKDEPEYIMVVTRDGSFTTYGTRTLRKMNIYNGRMTNVERSNIRRSNFIVNRKGTAVMQWGIDEKFEGLLSYKDKEGDWKMFDNGDDFKGVWPMDDQHTILKRNAGNNVYELVKFNRFNGKSQVITSRSNIDIDPILDRDRNMIGYETEENGRPVKVFFDEASPEALLRRLLERSFPGYQVEVSNGSDDGKLRVVTVHSDREPGKFFLYDADSQAKLSMLMAFKQNITRDRFSAMTPISFDARDGTKIHGYLSRPNGSKGKDPMIVMVHGGPFGIRDHWGWDPEVQLLTSHGYAVLQVNFRGSGGYGTDFEEAGHRQWGKIMQDDVTDGTLWAVKQGFADKDKMCIYGGSYGGYAALMGVVKEPDLYKCAIGYVGLYDLPLDLTIGDINETEEGRYFNKKTVGDDTKELSKYSPAHHADKIKAGIFLVHGGQDERVPVEHLEVMAKALDKVGHPYEKMVIEGEGHGFAENDNQYKLYGKMLNFFDKYLK